MYLFRNGKVKLANQKYTSVTNNFCLVFDQSATIQAIPDDGTIPIKAFDFMTIDKIQKTTKISLDSIGIVCKIENLSVFWLMDYTGHQIQCNMAALNKKPLITGNAIAIRGQF